MLDTEICFCFIGSKNYRTKRNEPKPFFANQKVNSYINYYMYLPFIYLHVLLLRTCITGTSVRRLFLFNLQTVDYADNIDKEQTQLSV